jgi:hypothetical protein
MRRIFGSNRKEIVKGCRKLHYEGLHKLCSSPNLINLTNYNDAVKENEIGRACSPQGAKRNACKVFVGKPENNGLLERPRSRREDNNMKLREIW